MTAPPPSGLLVAALPWLAAGFLLGLAFFATLGRTVALYANGRPVLAGLVHAGRIAVMVCVLFAAVRFGASSLLATALGIVIARWLVLRRLREERP